MLMIERTNTSTLYFHHTTKTKILIQQCCDESTPMKSIKYRLYFKILETRATFLFTHMQVVIMLLLGSLAKTVYNGKENSQDFFVKTKTKTKTLFLSSRRLETKTLVSRTTSLV